MFLFLFLTLWHTSTVSQWCVVFYLFAERIQVQCYYAAGFATWGAWLLVSFMMLAGIKTVSTIDVDMFSRYDRFLYLRSDYYISRKIRELLACGS